MRTAGTAIHTSLADQVSGMTKIGIDRGHQDGGDGNVQSTADQSPGEAREKSFHDDSPIACRQSRAQPHADSVTAQPARWTTMILCSFSSDAADFSRPSRKPTAKPPAAPSPAPNTAPPASPKSALPVERRISPIATPKAQTDCPPHQRESDVKVLAVAHALGGIHPVRLLAAWRHTDAGGSPRPEVEMAGRTSQPAGLRLLRQRRR